MANFEIGGIAYQSRMIDGETQTLLLKRLLPAFTAMISIKDDLVAAPSEGDEAPRERVSQLLMPVARELANLSDADVQFILNACMDVTSRQVGTGVGWAPVRQRGTVQDQVDGKFITRLTIAWHVLSENFGDMLASFGVDMVQLRGMAGVLG